MSLAPEELERFVASLASTPQSWSHLVRHQPDTRIHEQIFADENVNAWLICWSASHDTGFHDHDDSAGGIAVVHGRVREERLMLGSRAQAREFVGGERFSVPATAIHRVLHSGSEPAITIHAYSPPLARMGAYRIGEQGGLERVALSHQISLGTQDPIVASAQA